MTTWLDFEDAEPELAAKARAVLTSAVNGVLGTIRSDGSPRLSGIDPFFSDGELWIGSMPDARKGADLRRDPRMSLHGIPWESRRVQAEVTDPGDADVKLAGRAVEVTDTEEVERVLGGAAGASDLFRIEIDTVVVISVADDQLVIDRWSVADGRTTIRRS